MPFTQPPEVRRALVARVSAGASPAQAAAEVGVCTGTAYLWLGAEAPHLLQRPTPCCRCAVPSSLPADLPAYAQLLGLDLGDGCLSMARTTWALRITCDDKWPGIADEAADVMARVSGNKVHRARKQGCHDVQAYSQHWPCLFPQHGAGKKHDRPIVLEGWQQEVVQQHPGPLLRGLFHSGGWRGHNVAVHRAPDGFVTRSRYPRYEFTNLSADIRALCAEALDLLDIPWRPNGEIRISVARRAAVAALDEHVGPKH